MLAAIEALLKERIGLDAASLGGSGVGRAVRARQEACDLQDVEAYGALLRQSPAELQALVEAVVVPETWFFRDPGAFEVMARLVRERSASGRRTRLMSLPCSTGEEPYSISMALLDAGVPLDRFTIDAVDVSARSIARAQHAIYGRHAFRGAETGFRERHFEAAEGGFRPSEAVRRPVRFLRGNLLEPGFLPGGGGHDVIFCRNLLIYFDRPTQEAALRVLHGLLAPEGFLFLGPSETALPSRRDFVWLKLPMAFAFRKAPGTSLQAVASPVEAAPRRLRPIPSLPPMPQQAPALRAFRPAPPVAVSPLPVLPATIPRPAPAPRAGLAEAQRLADAGHLAEAVRQCEAAIREGGPSADAFHLLGLLRDAEGRRAEAVAQYRKALYLDPQHGEALAHLALLLEQGGDDAGAQMLRDRMARAARRSAG
ncbi:chemotaxis protein methyltransferase WspC [Roseomonas rosea]|uniref:Chemotaxis protein methyltransferase WspC n=1 Tax=Muricoccus roseus TaxID=198092 RepID=A0A1M6PDM0_9PROT|nr:protein-glutamate O-methyltransferase CheR [Roseomonas rosea]SHK06055.1 chemotaxis protein methyltransferase WspC [Roseomonas rosea]